MRIYTRYNPGDPEDKEKLEEIFENLDGKSMPSGITNTVVIEIQFHPFSYRTLNSSSVRAHIVSIDTLLDISRGIFQDPNINLSVNEVALLPVKYDEENQCYYYEYQVSKMKKTLSSFANIPYFETDKLFKIEIPRHGHTIGNIIASKAPLEMKLTPPVLDLSLLENTKQKIEELEMKYRNMLTAIVRINREMTLLTERKENMTEIEHPAWIEGQLIYMFFPNCKYRKGPLEFFYGDFIACVDKSFENINFMSHYTYQNSRGGSSYGGIGHPHIHNNGNACWGDYQQYLMEARDEKDMGMLMTIIHDYLNNTYIDDSAGGRVGMWPCRLIWENRPYDVRLYKIIRQQHGSLSAETFIDIVSKTIKKTGKDNPTTEEVIEVLL